MRVHLVLCISLLFLLVNVGFTQDDKPSFLPPYTPTNYVDEYVSDFLKSDSTCVVKNSAIARDVLGRKQHSVQEQNFSSCVEKKINVSVTSLDFYENEMQNVSGRYENYGIIQNYLVDGEIVSKEKYFNYINSIKRNEFKKSDYSGYLTAREIRDLMITRKPVAITKVHEYQNEESANFVDYTVILGLSKISSDAHANGYKGNGVGVYYFENDQRPHNSNVNTSYFSNESNLCKTSIHTAGVVSVLQKTAPEAMVYGFCNTKYPNPDGYNPSIEIGSHSWSNLSYHDKRYRDIDADMDNYIYNYRVINFVAAGNKTLNFLTYYVGNPGKALNAITVGAVSPLNDEYKSYSLYKNSIVGNQKPEVANYTDFQLTGDVAFVDERRNEVYDATMQGTSGATPYTAGMAADILDQHPFFKRHPEVFKALILTGSVKPINNAATHDMDNTGLVAKSLPQYDKMAWGTRSAYWNGNNSAFFDSNAEIIFTESAIEAHKIYKIAIAWLVPGSYVLANNMISQDLDLYVYQNGILIAQSEGSSSPFEIVAFETENSGDLTIRIKRYANSGVGDVILGYNFLQLN